MIVNNGPDRFCSQCGISTSTGNKFCGQCGSSLLNGGRSESNQYNYSGNEINKSVSQAPREDRVSPNIDIQKSVMAHPAIFFILYVVVSIPTYILPYFGSNSAAINSISAAMGYGFSPQFWLHLISLYILVIVAWFRGALIGRSWLASLPAIAGIFDLMPGMNWLPLAPTLFHVATLISGVSKEPLTGKSHGSGRWITAAIGFASLILLGFYHPASRVSKALLASSPMNREFSTEAGPAQPKPITPDYADVSQFSKIIEPPSLRPNEAQAVAPEVTPNHALAAAQERIDAERNKLSEWSAAIPSKISQIERIIARYKLLVDRTAQLKAKIAVIEDKYGADEFRSQQFDYDHTQIVGEANQAHDQVHAENQQASQRLREAKDTVLSQEGRCRATPQLDCNDLSAAMDAFQTGVTQLANATQREQESYSQQHERF